MADKQRVRLDADIEEYLQSQSERVLGKPGDNLSGAELTTLTNRLLYEHRLANQMAKQIPFARLFNWLTGLVSSTNSKIVSLPSADTPPVKTEDSFDFDADLGDLYEHDEAA